jgi:outer membrane protein assembly factor BamB
VSGPSRLSLPILTALSVLMCLLAGCTAVPFGSAPMAGSTWLMEGGNPQRMRTSGDGLAPPLFREREIEIEGAGLFASPPSIGPERLYVDMEGGLDAVAAADGSRAWRIRLKGFYLSPVVDGAHVYVRAEAGNQGALIALDAGNGDLLWQFDFPEVGSDAENMGGHVTAPLPAGRSLLSASGRNLHAVDRDTGAEVWRARLAEPVTSSVALGDGLAYVADFFNVYAFDTESGAEVWRHGDEQVAQFFAPVVVDGQVHVSFQNSFRALDGETGDVVWEADPAVSPVIPAGAGGDRVYNKAGHRLRAHDLQTGDVL